MLVFFFTDIEGSTRLWEEHTGEMGAVIVRHDAILQRQIAQSGGQFTKHTGDGVFAVFEGGQPLTCALEAQKQFAAVDWGAISELRIRIGLHAGEAELLHAGDYFGPAVNCTARVMSAAWGGQVLLTPEVTSIGDLPANASVLDLGEHLLKNVSAPQRILQLLHPELRWQEFPPPHTLSGESIRRAVDKEGSHIASLPPAATVVALLSAILVPTLQGDLSPDSPALVGNLGVLDDLGAVALSRFTAEFAARLQAAGQAGQGPIMSAVRQRLEGELLERWETGDETALAIRADASQLLQAVDGVEVVMAAATGDVRLALAQGLAALGSQFVEFRWMLAGVQDTLAEMRTRQELQLAMQREQLEKTDLLLQLQQEQVRVPVPALQSEAARPPAFLEEEKPYEPPVFVRRERELAKLEGLLDAALAGQGRVVFVTGDPGRGKTALLAEFARRAMEACPDLLVALGNCSAYSGLGDPYLPFREVLDMLTGDVEGRWASGLISTGHARRLWYALPLAIGALLAHGPHVAPALVSGKGLLSRALAAAPEGAPWLEPLQEQIARQAAGAAGVEQSHLFQQVTNVLRSLAESHPLLLILDDLQWVDTASIGLLFHLGRRLAGARILIAGAYRPEEVTLDRGGERHPLQKVVSEFKRSYGDVQLDLVEAEEGEGHRFVDALLETEPNCLGEEFRRLLAEHTDGHPLFTVELLRDMQGRGDLIRDEAGRWVQGPVLDWETLPARVEGVIEERVGGLEPELREILSVASVEGNAFTLQVVAQVQGMEERPLLRLLTQELERRHGLVLEQAEVQFGRRRLSRFQFDHTLVQNYLYQQLSQGERRLLHGEVAAALEGCYGEAAAEFAVQLAHHYHQAGNDGHALLYFTLAAENASRVYANDEAHAHYTRAIEAATRVSVDAASVIGLHLGRGLVSQTLGDFEGALADYESALQLAGSADSGDVEHLEWRALLDLGRLWASRDYGRAHDRFQDALGLAQRLDEPPLVAGSLNWMGNWHLNAENPREAIGHHQQALAIFEKLEDSRGLAATLDLLGIASLLGGHMTASVGYYDRAIELFRELGDLPSLASSLTGRGTCASWQYASLALVSSTAPIHPRHDLEEALRIYREIGSPAGEAWALWSLGLLDMVQGRYGQALEAAHSSLDIATQIGHREYTVAAQCVLGILCGELLAPETARLHLETALTTGEELRSGVLSHWATGALAAAHCLLGDLTQARTCLQTVLSWETPMDTAAQRYCWARWAELALCQGDPALTLDIVERLIASAAGMSSGRGITFLWKLEGEALTTMGHPEQARPLLEAAIENAQVTGERFLLWRIHAGLGRVYHALGRYSDAEAEVATARKLVEELADTVPGGDMRDNFLQRAYDMVRSSP